MKAFQSVLNHNASLSLSLPLSLRGSVGGGGGIFCYSCAVLPQIPAIYELNLLEINNKTE